jgi:ribonucleoside-triphosphate reductase
VTNIVDIMNLIGQCVGKKINKIVSGNVRRSAEIAFGEFNSDEFINLKNYKLNPQRMEWGWTSNNSIFAKIGMNYEKVSENIKINGEPGICFLENMKKYSRMVKLLNNFN